jgi:hypothetical protein
MKRATIFCLSFVLVLSLFAVRKAAADVCWQFDNFSDTIWVDFKLSFDKKQLITGSWAIENQSRVVLLVGTFQPVLPGNVDSGQISKQLSAYGSVFSPEFGEPKAKHCGIHMLFNDKFLSTGRIYDWCSYFDDANADIITAQDKFLGGSNGNFYETFHKVSCFSVPNP